MTDRWRIAPPPYELDENSRGRKIGTTARAPIHTTRISSKAISRFEELTSSSS